MSRLGFLAPTRVLGALRRRLRFIGVYFFYRPSKIALLETTVLFESFQGRVIGDNPLAIFYELQRRRPDLDLVWAVSSDDQTIPEGSRAVRWGSIEWLRLLASAKYLVNNANFPFFFRKSKGQIYLQTWHGTPLKRLGRDIPDVPLNVGYQATMEREARSWDFLIAPNEFFAEVFPKAFQYEGKLLLTGYPRNDVLVSQTSEQRLRIRSKLGLSPQDLAVLYAPTWRDYERTASGEWGAFNYLPSDLELPESARLLFRGHHNTIASHSAELARGAIDVTEYDDIAELYIACDVLITDYSSSMFDFTVTKKPIIFFVPDLERYRAERGFYFNYEDEVPGPMLKSEEELPETLANIPSLKKMFAKKYRSWNAKFNALEDGYAAKRVVDQVWGNS